MSKARAGFTGGRNLIAKSVSGLERDLRRAGHRGQRAVHDHVALIARSQHGGSTVIGQGSAGTPTI